MAGTEVFLQATAASVAGAPPCPSTTYPHRATNVLYGTFLILLSWQNRPASDPGGFGWHQLYSNYMHGVAKVGKPVGGLGQQKAGQKTLQRPAKRVAARDGGGHSLGPLCKEFGQIPRALEVSSWPLDVLDMLRHLPLEVVGREAEAEGLGDDDQ